MNAVPASPYRANPVFWIMLLLPAAAVVGGLATLFIALRNADHPLPANYHSEGVGLDREFALARAAAAHGIELSFASTGAECTATLRNAPDDPESLSLLFTNGVDPGLDRVILLRRARSDGKPGAYRGACAPLPAGRWYVVLQDDAAGWAIRSQLDAAATFTLRARDPDTL
jgi:uncharacterized protein